MGPYIVDDEQITRLQWWELTIDGKLIVVLAERAYEIVALTRYHMLFTEHADLVVRTIHTWAHQVGHGCVEASVVAIGMLQMAHMGQEIAVRTGDQPPALHCQGRWSVLRTLEQCHVGSTNPCPKRHQIERRLFGPVGDANTPTKIDQFDGDAELGLELAG